MSKHLTPRASEFHFIDFDKELDLLVGTLGSCKYIIDNEGYKLSTGFHLIRLTGGVLYGELGATTSIIKIDKDIKKARVDAMLAQRKEDEEMELLYGVGPKKAKETKASLDEMVAISEELGLYEDKRDKRDKPVAEWPMFTLPPVGAECELEFAISMYSEDAQAIIKVPEGSKVEINGAANFGNGDVRIFSGHLDGKWFTSFHKAIAFRPIKTDAQLKAEREAEERKEFAYDIEDTINGNKDISMRQSTQHSLANDIYDYLTSGESGYRLTKGSTE